MTRDKFLDSAVGLGPNHRAVATRVLTALSGEVEEHKDELMRLARVARKAGNPRAAAAYDHESYCADRMARWLDGAAGGTLDMETELRLADELEGALT
jgi:hypothetical protein